MTRVIPIPVIILLGIGLIALTVYADSQYIEPQFDATASGQWLAQFTASRINFTSGEYVKDCTEQPYFKTFPEELSWYTQCEPTLMIEESNCDKLVTKYRAGNTQDKINYSFRILELCEI